MDISKWNTYTALSRLHTHKKKTHFFWTKSQLPKNEILWLFYNKTLLKVTFDQIWNENEKFTKLSNAIKNKISKYIFFSKAVVLWAFLSCFLTGSLITFPHCNAEAAASAYSYSVAKTILHILTKAEKTKE